MHLYHMWYLMPKGFNKLSNLKPTTLTKADCTPPKTEGILNNAHIARDSKGNVVNPREHRAIEDRKRMNVIACTGLLFVLFGQIYMGYSFNNMSRSIDRMIDSSLTGSK